MPQSGLIFQKESLISNVPLKSIKVECSINNTLVNVTSHLIYSNELQDPVEAVFVFPLDELSAIYHFEAVIDDRCIIAECQEKSEAQETYDRAVDDGYMAFLLEEDDRCGDTFRCSLGNLPAKKEAVITLKFITQMSVVNEKGKNLLKFVLPSILNPRYDPKGDQGRNTLQNDAVFSSSSLPYTFKFEGCIVGSRHIESISSPISNDKFALEYLNDNKTEAKVILNSQFKFDHDLTFCLTYTEDHKPFVWYEPGDPQSDNLALKMNMLMVNFFPKFDQESSTQVKNEFIFVVDRSGSMSGSRIQQAKESLLLLLKSLPVDCRFDIIGFGSRYSSLFDQVMDYNETNLDRALSYQKSMAADMGGTEILSPLQHIYSHKPSHGFVRNILLLTDGDVSNTNEVTALVSKHNESTRVFAIGIGEGVSTALINSVTRAGKGRAEFVRNSSELRSSVMSLLHSSMQSRFSESSLKCNLPDGVTATIVPKCLPPLFGNNYCTVFVCLSGETDKLMSSPCSVVLSGKLNDKELSFEIPFTMKNSKIDGDFPVRRLAAKYEIAEMCENEEDKIDKAAVIFLSTKCNILSRYTSMVGVDPQTKNVSQAIRKEIPVLRLYDTSAGLDMFYCGAGMTDAIDAPINYKCKSRRKSAFPSISNPFKGMSLFSRTKKSAKAPNSSQKKRASSLQAECFGASVDEDFSGCGSSSDPILLLADLQTFDGSWKWEAKIFDILKIGEENAKKMKPDEISDSNVWTTILVMTFFESSCQKDKLQWSFMVEKARSWLNGKMVDQSMIEKYCLAAKQLF